MTCKRLTEQEQREYDAFCDALLAVSRIRNAEPETTETYALACAVLQQLHNALRRFEADHGITPAIE